MALVIFGSMIFIHELGHFLIARACKVTVKEFALGMGPKLVSKVAKKTNIRYSLRAFPIGGFVSMEGEGEESTDENAFCKKPVWQRMLIIAAGPTMNLILGFLSMFLLITVYLVSGYNLPSNVVGAFNENATSCNYGLQVGDEIVKVNRTYVHTGYEVNYELMNSGYKSVDITVLRDGERIVLDDIVFPTEEDESTGVVFGDIDFKCFAAEKNFGMMLKYSFYWSCSTVKMVWDSLIGLLSGRYGLKAMSGPVGITKEIGTAAQTGGFTTVLHLFAMITINLGVFNLLPIPALDGGQLVFLLVELITRKKVSQNVIGIVNFAGLILMFGLMAVITLKDVIGLFG